MLLLKYLKQPRYLILQILAFIFVLLANIFSVILPILTGALIDNSTASQNIDTKISIIILISLSVSFIFTFLQLFISTYISERIGFDIRNDLIKKIVEETYAFIDKVTPSKILTNLTTDISNIKNFLANGLSTLLTSVITIIGSFVLMFKINSTLALIILPILPILIIAFGLIIKKMVTYFKLSQESTDSLNKSIDENIKGSMLVKVFVSEEEEKQKFDNKNQNQKNISVNIVKTFSYLIPLINVANYFAIVIVLFVGGNFIADSKLQSGELIAFYQYVQLFIFPIIVLGFIGNSIGQVFVSSKRINDIMDHDIDFDNGEKKLSKFESIEYKNVNLDFAYELKKQTVLEDVNLQIQKGQMVGIIGMSGSGKSMIIQLLLRFFDPTNGKILLNGNPINEYDIKSLRLKTGLVFQENFIFNSSIKENILFGSEDVTEEYFNEVVKIAEVDEFVRKLPNKYDEIIGERGSTLSGGQKQRITIARALINKPEILILDDSTSKLDSLTEKKIIDNILKNLKGITIVMISQKISSVKNADIIFVIDEGKVSDYGSHNELIQKSFIYREIELAQSNIANE